MDNRRCPDKRLVRTFDCLLDIVHQSLFIFVLPVGVLVDRQAGDENENDHGQSFLVPHKFLGIGAAMLLYSIDPLPHLMIMTQHVERE